MTESEEGGGHGVALSCLEDAQTVQIVSLPGDEGRRVAQSYSLDASVPPDASQVRGLTCALVHARSRSHACADCEHPRKMRCWGTRRDGESLPSAYARVRGGCPLCVGAYCITLTRSRAVYRRGCFLTDAASSPCCTQCSRDSRPHALLTGRQGPARRTAWSGPKVAPTNWTSARASMTGCYLEPSNSSSAK